MKLRIATLLLLCLSVSMCAVLYRHQEAPEERETIAVQALVVDAPANGDGAVADAPVVEALVDGGPGAEEAVAEPDVQIENVPEAVVPAAEEPSDEMVAEEPAAEYPAVAAEDTDAMMEDMPAADEPVAADVPEPYVPATDVPEAVLPEVDIPAAADVPEPDVPETEVPEAVVPEVDIPAAADVPEPDVPATDVPEAVVPEVDIPAAADVPEAEVPEAVVPEAVALESDVPATDVPAADVPVDNVPEADVPIAEVPEVPEPDVPEAQVPEEYVPIAEILESDVPEPDVPDTDNVLAANAEADADVTDEELAQMMQALEEMEHSFGDEEEEESSWGFGSVRTGFQALNGYFNSLVEMVGGQDGVCQYRCKDGETPLPRPDFQMPEPDGCTNPLMGFQVYDNIDLGVPAMTKCCDLLDMCYDTCGTSKVRCDSKFRWCMHGICSDLEQSLGFVSKVQACESMADVLYKTVSTLGCNPYMNSQRAACYCEEETREEL